LACLWLLMALLPLRSWASADMMVAMAVQQAPMSDAHVGSQPPCHEAAEAAHDEGVGTETDARCAGTACGCCPFCAWALAMVGAAPHSLAVVRDAGLALTAGAAPSGDPEPFFRPPRA
jgi:hypothetical protein